MSSRRKFRAAAGWIVPAVVLFTAGSAGSPLLAQSENSPAAVNPIPAPQGESAVFDAPGMPGVRMMAPRPDTPSSAPSEAAVQTTIVPGASMTVPAAAPSVTSGVQAAPGGVFDAPNMPGVRMMAPIPDSQPVVTSPVAASAAIPTAARTAPAAVPAGRRSLLDQTVAAAKEGAWSRAQRLAGESGSRPAALLVEWLYLTDGGSDASFVQISAFLNAYPNWPRRDTLIARAEEAMPADADAKLVIEWYGDRTPLTASGMIRLGEAHLAAGNRDRGTQLIRTAWCEESFSAQEETDILRTHANILRDADHRARLDQRLAVDDIAAARRQIARVDGESRRVAEARLRLKSSPEAVASVMASLPAELHGNRGLLHDASRAYRRRDKNEEAYQVLLKTPAERGVASAPEQWWSERHTLARDALKDKRYQLAYDIVSRHGLVSGGGFADAEFLSGWIALRYLNKPDAALKHFQTLAGGVSLPISVARAYYWSGRAEEAMQHPNEAISHYRRAAQNGETFYGQLALARVEESPVLRLPATSHVPTRAEEAAFEADERIGVIRVLFEARDRNLARIFAVRIANDDPPDAKKLQMLAQLMNSLGDPAMGVRVAKLASYNGVMLLSHLAPVVTLPRFPGTAAGPDPALVLGVTRQESEFDPAVVSSAGARGLMQLMPATAQRAASMNRLGFKLGDLTTNPRYNMQLGMVTLDDYLAYWGDSYVLAIASYNAGPTNVRKWVEAYGDPRDSSVDPIDWIENIPFSETRNYVQRVLENIEVYRNRLSGSDQRLTILSDLYRPKLPNRVVLKEQAPPLSEIPIPVQRPGATALQ
jgi:soluble lytic murein transglycosylase